MAGWRESKEEGWDGVGGALIFQQRDQHLDRKRRESSRARHTQARTHARTHVEQGSSHCGALVNSPASFKPSRVLMI